MGNSQPRYVNPNISLPELSSGGVGHFVSWCDLTLCFLRNVEESDKVKTSSLLKEIPTYFFTKVYYKNPNGKMSDYIDGLNYDQILTDLMSHFEKFPESEKECLEILKKHLNGEG